MDLFLIIRVALIAFLGIKLYRNPKQWLHYLRFFPLTVFMVYARSYGMTNQAWYGAFVLAGLCSLAMFAILVNKRVMLDRLMLGVNLFFLVGACGFLFNVEEILQWYSETRGGPFFGCIALVGVLSILFTKAGFIGVKNKSNKAIQYSSFLLFAATIISWVWSVRYDDQGLGFAVVLPCLLLFVVRDQLIKHVD